jgi:ATP-dependent Clp protease ATP-binding subunit ClpA
MPKINVYLPDEMAIAVRDAQLPVSAICQAALERAVRELTAMRATDSAPGADATSVPFSRYTARARHVLVLGDQAAQQRHHNYIGTEHLLLGILDEDTNLALTVLATLEVEQTDLRNELIASMGAASPAGATGAEEQALPFTPLAKKALEGATREALGLGHNYVGCEHLLLGLVAVEDGLAGQVLRRMGIEARTVRRAVVSALSGFLHARDNQPPTASDAVLQEILSRLDHLEQRLGNET